MIDRSISSLRTLRPDTDFDKSIFWFRDDLHQPYAISPMGMTTIQAHHSWGYHVAAKETSLPPSKGGHVKVYQGRVYIGFALIDDPEEVGARAEEFGKLIGYCMEHWDEYYQKYKEEVISDLDSFYSVDSDKLKLPHLLEHLKRAERANRRHWEIHFTLMYPADAIYFTFVDYCKKHGVEEEDFVIMLRGIENIALRTDEEIWNLAKLAEERGIKELLLSTPTEDLMQALSKTPEAASWLETFRLFLSVYGNRVVAANLDIATPTWAEDPIPVLDTIKSYYPRIESGWDYYKSKDDVKRQKEEAIQKFESDLETDAEKEEFRRMLKAAQGVYSFQEDHGFYIDQGSTAMMRSVVIACGKRLYRRNLIKEIEDVIYLTYHELVEVMEALVYNEEIAIYHYGALVPNMVDERKDSILAANASTPPLTFGNVPEKMTDPIGIKVFGIIDEVLHPQGEREVEERLEGFPGAPGVVEGPAKVVIDYKDFQTVKVGEILVCPYTGTAWTSLFMKIAGVVTDTGGMLTHAAIAAREYDIPAVVGTWNATNSINDGDIIKVDGNVGVVEVIKRAN